MKTFLEAVITTLGCLIGYAIYGLVGSLLALITATVGLVLAPIPVFFPFMLGLALHYGLKLLTRVVLPVLQVYRIKEFSGFEKRPEGVPSIIIGNHCGKLDGPLILGEIKKTAAIMKLKYATLPMYKGMVKYLNFVSLDTSSNRTLDASVTKAREVLSLGHNLLIYPEGKRAKGSRLLHFKDFAFRIAQETGYPIIPVVLYSKYPFMSGTLSSIFPMKKNIYVMRALDPVYVERDEVPADVAARVRKRMIKELDQIKKDVENGS